MAHLPQGSLLQGMHSSILPSLLAVLAKLGHCHGLCMGLHPKGTEQLQLLQNMPVPGIAASSPDAR